MTTVIIRILSLASRHFNVSFVLLALAGCGGGGGSSSPSTPEPQVPDGIPDSFAFVGQENVQLDSVIVSNAITVSGINQPADINVTNGEYRIGSGEFTSASGTVTNGQQVAVRHVSADSFSGSVDTVLSIGGVSATFTSSTGAQDSVPDAFSFAAVMNSGLGVPVISNAITVSGINTPVSISVAGGAYSIDGAAYTNDVGEVRFGQTVTVQHIASAAFSTATQTELTIGGVSATFISTSAASDITPDPFVFVDQTNVPQGATIISQPVTITGLNDVSEITIVGGEYSVDDGPYSAAAGSISNGQSVRVQHISASQFSASVDTVLTIGGVSDTFTSTTNPPDTTPDSFAFDAQLNVEPASLITANTITVSGINSPVALTINGGEYSLDGGAYTDVAATVLNGQTLSVRHTSADDYATDTNTALSVGDFTATFTSTTWPIGTGFNKASGFNGYVADIAKAIDGSGDIYMVGTFTVYNNETHNRIIRFNADGSVDNTFDIGEGFNNFVTAIALATDGSGDIYLSGIFSQYQGLSYNGIIRLNSDGSVDTNFDLGSSISPGFSGSVTDLAVSADGSGDIYVVGNFIAYDRTPINRIVRLNSDGSTDSDFNVGSGFDAELLQVVAATNGTGDIYVRGRHTSFNGNPVAPLVRLNSNGTLDTGLNIGGGFDRGIRRIAYALDGSGDLYVGGDFNSYNGTASEGLIRLNSNGSVDSTFQESAFFPAAVDTFVLADDGSNDVYAISSSSGFGDTMTRFNGNGSIDSTFVQGSGFSGGRIRSIANGANGQIIVGGEFISFNDISSKGLAAINPDGTLDTRLSAATGFDSPVNKIVATTDGSNDIFALGSFMRYQNTFVDRIVRLRSEGDANTEFVNPETFYRGATDILPVNNGSGDIYLLGSTALGGPDTIIRFNSDGSVNTSFAAAFEARRYTTMINAADTSNAIYAVALFSSSIGNADLIRINADGSADASFDTGTGFNANIAVVAAALDGSGDIYVGGEFTSYNGEVVGNIVRLNNDGSLDEDFNVGTGVNNDILEISVVPGGTGDLYIGGEFTSFNGANVDGLIRINSDGSLDSAFSFESITTFQARTIAHVNDGSGDIYVGGFFANRGNIIRLNSDGSQDTSFNFGVGFNARVFDIVVANDGSEDIFVGGAFTSYKETVVDYIARLNPDGSVN